MIISKTPLRISFAGGGTDFKKFYSEYEGCVCSATIDKYIYVILKKRYDKQIVINYTNHEVAQNIESVKHDYVRAVLDYFNLDGGLEITTIADISGIGSGLGSSSSLIVGLVNACQAYKNMNLTKADILQIATILEIRKLNQPIGIQDHCAAVMGGINKFVFYKSAITIKPIFINRSIVNSLNSSLLLLNIGKKNKTAKEELAKQSSNCDRNMEKIRSLSNYAHGCAIAICNGNIDKIAYFINAGWEIKRYLSDTVSNSEIDNIINSIKNAGALAAKVCGSGGGGHLLVVVDPKKRNKIIEKLELDELPFNISFSGSEIIYDNK